MRSEEKSVLNAKLNDLLNYVAQCPIDAVGPVVPPPVEGGGVVPPNHPVDFDFGEGGGTVFPDNSNPISANQPLVVAFTVRTGGNPQLDVFPGVGGWLATQITDSFPNVSPAETRDLPRGTQSDGRGTEHAAGIPMACYTPGRYYYQVQVNQSQSWHIQFRQ